MSKKETIQELLGRKSIQKPVNTEKNINVNAVSHKPGSATVSTNVSQKKKKATFDLNPKLHTKLKVFAAQHDMNMVDIVEDALEEFFEKRK